MAQKIPTFNPMVDPTEFSPKPVISGVKNKGATMGALADMGSIGLTALDAINTQNAYESLDTKIGALNEQYLTQPTQDEMTALAGDAEADRLFMENMPSMAGFETGEQIETTYSQVEKNYNDKLATLQKALSQERITPADFTMRAKKITREVVAANPHLTSELIRRLSQNLSLSGVQEKMDYETQFAQNAEKAYQKRVDMAEQKIKELQTSAGFNRSNYVDESGNLILELAEPAIDQFYANTAAAKAFKEGAEEFKIRDEADILMVKKSGYVPKVLSGAMNLLNAEIAQIFLEAGDNFAAGKLRATNHIYEQMAMYRSHPSIAPLLTDSDIKAEFDFFQKNVEALKNSYESFASGKDASDFIKNQRSFMEDQQMIQVMKTMNIPAVELAIKAATSLQMVDSKDVIATRTALVKAVQGLLTNFPVGDATSIVTPAIPGSPSPAGAIVNEAIKSADKNPEQLNEVVTNFGNVVNSPNANLTEPQRFSAYDEFIKSTGDPKVLEHVEQWSPEGRATYQKILDEYVGALSGNLSKYILTNPDKNINIAINETTGRLTVTGDDVGGLNQNIVSRIDNALKSYANLNGVTTKEAAQRFYTEHFSDALLSSEQVSTLNNNPIGISLDGKKESSFTSIEEGLQATERKVLELYAGEQGIGKRTIKQLVKALKPDSLSKGGGDLTSEQVIDYVSKTMGVGANDRLDLLNRGTMSQFLHAMAAANGVNINPNRIHKHLNKESTMGLDEADIAEINREITKQAYLIFKRPDDYNSLSDDERAFVDNIVDPPLENTLAPWEMLWALEKNPALAKIAGKFIKRIPAISLGKLRTLWK